MHIVTEEEARDQAFGIDQVILPLPGMGAGVRWRTHMRARPFPADALTQSQQSWVCIRYLRAAGHGVRKHRCAPLQFPLWAGRGSWGSRDFVCVGAHTSF